MKLKEARLRNNKTQAQVAEYAEISLRSYQYIEKGQQMPSVVTGLKIAKILRTSPVCIDEFSCGTN
ncbi:helix-turn-helix transcriptional regulator [Paenibacillus polymyxa]|uniref:helix-turn-helix transcriptional regulator n=1 Tax=Paenibacillus polymyxa TaxID=1406 RepID=UPI0025B6A80C|nr:helix-turn-helix transcriptional regulator [Paenibacillus polymyxa]MDN4106124.1 helix-turn-helix transcriptional regulator [Paenibacillus polymyxa]